MNFKTWFEQNLSEQASDIANHGADCGFPHITYTSDTVDIFDRFSDEIWEMAVEDAESMDIFDRFRHKNVAEMIADFRRADMLSSLDQFKNLMVWYACEKLANEMENASE